MLTLSSMAAIAKRPDLWLTALRQARRLMPTRWWRRPGASPLPPREYIELRMQTQYGHNDATPTSQDVVNYLQWCRDIRSDRPARSSST